MSGLSFGTPGREMLPHVKPACENLAKPVEKWEMRRRDSTSRRALGLRGRRDVGERARNGRREFEFFLCDSDYGVLLFYERSYTGVVDGHCVLR